MTETTNDVMQGLWVGAELSVMERLSISSFLRNGHEFHLYVYREHDGVPEGTTLRDASEILPASAIFQYRDRKTYSGFANFFRYRLLLEKGGWWVDIDTVCLKPFVFTDPYVFSSEPHGDRDVINNGIIKTPPASEIMSYAWRRCQMKDLDKLVHGETGPRLMGEAVERFSLSDHVRSHQAFCPLPAPDWDRVLDPDAIWDFDRSTYGIHLWNEQWRRYGRDKNARYPSDCLYEKLKYRYLGP